MRPLRQRDGGAGFLIRGKVGQVVVHGEALIVRAGADAPGEVLIALGGVAPNPVEHRQQALVARLRRHVRGARHQVGRPHGMPLDVLVIPDRHIVLKVGTVVLVERDVVFGGEESPAPGLDKEPCQVEVACVASGAPQLHQGQFDLRMPGVARPLGRRPKHGVNIVREAGGDVQEVGLAGGLVMRHSRLKHVAGAIKLVPVAKVGPAFSGLLDREIAVEVAVGLLRRGEQTDDIVQLLFERRIGVGGNRVGGGLEGFIEVRIHENRPAKAVCRAAARQPDVLDIASLLQLLQAEGNAGYAVRLAPRRPE